VTKPVCFVVSPIGKDGSDDRKRADMVLRFVIEPAAEKAGLKAQRADASNAPGDITVQLLDDLMSARAVIADLSGLNPNVFYELAVAHSFRKPVVTIADEGTSLPFDIVAQRTIFFDYLKVESIDAGVERIAKGLEAAMAEPGKNSPIARAAEWQPLRHGNSTERAIADLSNQMDSLRAEVRSVRESTPWDEPRMPLGLLMEISKETPAPTVTNDMFDSLSPALRSALITAQMEGWASLDESVLEELHAAIQRRDHFTVEGTLLMQQIELQLRGRRSSG
jgi:hypothetical protein